MHSMVTVVNNAALHIWKVLKEQILKLRKKDFVTMYSDGG